MKRFRPKKRKTGAGLFASLASVLLLGGALLGGVWLANRFLPHPFERAKNADGAAGANYSSLARALAGLDSARLKSFYDAYSNPQKIAGVKITPGEPIRINSEALARRHPAWILADSLAGAGVEPRRAREISVTPRAPFSLVPQSVASAPDLREQSGQTIERRAAVSDLERAQKAQFEAFGRDWQNRQASIRADEEALRLRELEDQIREKLRAEIQVVGLEGVDAATALELSNLRLQLLQNLAISPLQRERARTRIQQIEERLAAIWRAQTAKQEALLEEAFQTAPARLRREGLENIRRALAQITAADLAERNRVQNELESLAARDFEAARAASLRLFLPPVTFLSGAQNTNFFEPGQSQLPSAGTALKARGETSKGNTSRVPPLAQITPAASGQIALLRAKARADAVSWSKQIAGQLGGTLSNSPQARDFTAQAQKLLWPSTTG